ncbi:DUF1766-domain-containing protein [Backusella circina FSU 941]|nr:DUF1766-domain-containing protein [Backusella circina FSU 941]
MLRSCQSRIAFSKSKWYASAINHVFKPIVLAQLRRSSTATAVLVEDTTLPEQPKQEDRRSVVPQDNYRRCDGFKIYDGGRCQRLVRIDERVTGPVFCFNHHPDKRTKFSLKKKRSSPELKRIPPTASLSPSNDSRMKESSIFKAPRKLFNCWDLWLGGHIKKDVKEIMLKEMIKPVNRSDRPGYIYVYTLQKGRRASGKRQVYFKVGRTIDPHRRMYQLNNMCDHEPKIVELFPSFPQQNKKMVTNLETLGDESLDTLPKCPLPARVEKLIHLELFSMFKKAGFKCSKCETEHREWIKVARGKHPEEDRLLTDHELWVSRIRPVIVKWMQYGVLVSALAEAHDGKEGNP